MKFKSTMETSSHDSSVDQSIRAAAVFRSRISDLTYFENALHRRLFPLGVRAGSACHVLDRLVPHRGRAVSWSCVDCSIYRDLFRRLLGGLVQGRLASTSSW